MYVLSLSGAPASGTIMFNFAVDNGGKVEFLNSAGAVIGSPLVNIPGGNFSTPNGVGFLSATSYSGGIASGAVSLKVTVFNDSLPPGNGAGSSGSPTGFFLDGMMTNVPEPSTITMLSLGGVAILFARLRRKA